MKLMQKSKNSILLFNVILCCVFFLGDVVFAGSVNLPKTGQTTKYVTGDDGDLKVGTAWPNPRFTDNLDGTMTDNMTGLMWMRSGNIFKGTLTSNSTDAKIADLNANPSGYTDGGYKATYTDWRMPNVNELESLVNAGFVGAQSAWLWNQGFVNVASYWYWTSSYATYTSSDSCSNIWAINMNFGSINKRCYYSPYVYGNPSYVWPVRSTQ